MGGAPILPPRRARRAPRNAAATGPRRRGYDARMARGFLIAFLLSFGPTVSNSFARFAYALVLPAMRTDLALDWSSAGWLNTANAIGYLGGALLARFLVRTAGNRALFSAGMLITAAALLATGLVRDVGALSLARALSGVGGAMVFVCGGALSGNVFPGQPQRATTTIAIYFAGGGFGLMLCGVAVPLLLRELGDAAWPIAWRAMGAASFAMAAASVWAAYRIEEPGAAPGSAEWRLAPFLPQFLSYVCFGLGYIGYMTFVIAWMRVNGAGTGLVIAVWTVLGAATLAAPAVWAGPCERWRGGRPLAAVMAVLATGAILPMASVHPAAMLASAALFGGRDVQLALGGQQPDQAPAAQARLGLGDGDLHRRVRREPDRRAGRDRLDRRPLGLAATGG
jgi:MFS family permease